MENTLKQNSKYKKNMLIIFKIIVCILLISLTCAILYNGKHIVSNSIEWIYLALLLYLLLILNIPKNSTILKPLILLICPLISFYIVEYLSLDGNTPFNFEPKILLINILLYCIIYSIIYILSNLPTISLIFCNTFFYIISIVNYYIIKYRGRALFPNDITAIKTLSTVVHNFSFKITPEIIVATYLFTLLSLVIAKYPIKKEKIKKNIISKSVILTCCIITLYTFSFTKFLFNIGINDYQWYGHLANGVALNFTLEGNLSRVNRPNDYSKKSINLASKNTVSKSTTNLIKDKNISKQPNIIVIMNESFSDLRCVGNFETNKPVMGFLDSLKENTIKGYALSSVYGGGTATSEFEFLTGCSTAFLPSSIIAYQSYINGKTPSLVSTLKKQGYSTIAFHPYDPKNYNRINTYSNLGFDKFYSADNLKITDKDKLRWYASDQYDFRELINLYENKKPNEKLFIFNVTMQNHFDYSSGSDNFNEKISIKNFDRINYPCANRYLSLLYESDKAFESLINYFKTADEPTIILMYGDHQAFIEDSFIKSLLGKSKDSLTLKEKQKLYTVPFYIWANYDIDEKFIDCTSINYLSTYLLDATNVKKNNYLNMLTNLRNEIPAINNLGYLDNSNKYHEIDNNCISNSDNKLLHQYQILQYNYLFDSKNRLNNFFG